MSIKSGEKETVINILDIHISVLLESSGSGSLNLPFIFVFTYSANILGDRAKIETKTTGLAV